MILFSSTKTLFELYRFLVLNLFLLFFNMGKDVSNKEWTNWLENGLPKQKRLNLIAEKIRAGDLLTKKEQSIYQFHATEIELILKSFE